MANVDFPRGMWPIGHLSGGTIRTNTYLAAGTIYRGDLVTAGGGRTITASSADAGITVLGVAAEYGVSGTLTGGQMTGTGATVLSGPLTMGNFASVGLDEGRTLRIAGGATWSYNSFNLNPANTGNAAAGRIVNAAGSTINDISTSGSNVFTQNFGGTDNGASASFTNLGTYTKTGAGNTNIGVNFINSGTLNVNAGTLTLSGGGTHTGVVVTGAGTLSFQGGVHSFDAASTIGTANVARSLSAPSGVFGGKNSKLTFLIFNAVFPG